MSANKLVIARYSALKVAGWIALVASVSLSVLADGASRGWRLPEGRYGWLFPEAAAGSAFFLVASIAMICNFAINRGVAIARIGNDFVLYFPFYRKRVAIGAGVSVSSMLDQIEVPSYGAWFKSPPALVARVVIQRANQNDVKFPTALLRDRADVVVQRMSEQFTRA